MEEPKITKNKEGVAGPEFNKDDALFFLSEGDCSL
jgi:hypothetical protein